MLDGAPVLREKAREVPVPDIKKGLYKAMVADMQATLLKCHDGVALAAPQVGKSIRLFVISPKVFQAEQELGDGRSELGKSKTVSPKLQTPNSQLPRLVYFNPKIKKVSASKKDLDEGCLSVNGLYGKVPRSTKALIEAYDEYGMKFTRGASGLLAQIFQHEVDHLDGILYIDKASELKQLESRKTDA